MKNLTQSEINSIDIFLTNMSSMPRDRYIHFVTIKWGLENFNITDNNSLEFVKLLKEYKLSHVLGTDEKPEFKLTVFSISILEQHGSFLNYITNTKNKSEYENDIFNFTKYGLIVGVISAIIALASLVISLKSCSVNKTNDIDNSNKNHQASPTEN